VKKFVLTFSALALAAFSVTAGAAAESEESKGLKDREYYRSLPPLERILTIAGDYAEDKLGLSPAEKEDEARRGDGKRKKPDKPGDGKHPPQEPPQGRPRPGHKQPPRRPPHPPRPLPPLHRAPPMPRARYSGDGCDANASGGVGILALFAALALANGESKKKNGGERG
jgi:hypothetical protein